MDTDDVKTFGQQLLSWFLIGLTVILPTALVVGLTYWAYTLIDGLFAPIISIIEANLHFAAPRIVWVAVLSLLTVSLIVVLGRFIETQIGEWFHHHFDNFLERVHPLYKMVRDSVKLLIDSIGQAGLVSRVVEVDSNLVVGGRMFALLAADCEEAFTQDGNTELLTIFLMHGPIGNTGFVLRVPRSSMYEVDYTIADFMTKYNLRLGNGIIARWRRAQHRAKEITA